MIWKERDIENFIGNIAGVVFIVGLASLFVVMVCCLAKGYEAEQAIEQRDAELRSQYLSERLTIKINLSGGFTVSGIIYRWDLEDSCLKKYPTFWVETDQKTKIEISRQHIVNMEIIEVKK